ncbi:MAG: MFS transporter [Coriobacteriales bacterium]|jgi:predicted MFS family arabinose efflux permease|nr:MFS transporter [Coriobacteriales bacterium]
MKNRQAWIVALATIFAGISLALVQNKVAPCMTTLISAFSIDMATAGWLSSLFSLVGIVVALPASVILNRFGPKKGGAFALACAIIGSLVGVFTNNAVVLMLTRIIEGIGVGLISVIGPSLIAMWFPESRRGLPMSVWGAYQMGAQAVMFFLGSTLTLNFGWQGMWWFALAVCVVALVFYLLCVKSPRPEDSYADVESTEVRISEGIKSPFTWLISLVTMLFCVGCFGFVNWIATCWMEIFAWDEGQANMWVGFFSIGGLVAAVIIGAVLNKVRNRRLFGMIALVFYGVISLVGMNLPNPGLIVVFVVVYAFADAGFPCVLWTMAAQTVNKPELAGVAMGVVCVGFNVGILLGPPITGAVAEAWGWFAASVLICAVCLAATVLLRLVRLYAAADDAAKS